MPPPFAAGQDLSGFLRIILKVVLGRRADLRVERISTHVATHLKAVACFRLHLQFSQKSLGICPSTSQLPASGT